jgi:hypothetical protein
MAQNQGMAPFDPALFRQSENVQDRREGSTVQQMYNDVVDQEKLAPLPQEPLDPEMAQSLENLEIAAEARMNQRIFDEMRKSQPKPKPKSKKKK